MQSSLPPSLVRCSPRLKELVSFADERGIPGWRLKQIVAGYYKQGANRWMDLQHIPITLRMELKKQFGGIMPRVAPVDIKMADHARKVLFQTKKDGAKIEGVALFFRNHTSLCISSQAGCAFGCSFCATGKVGFKRHLSPDEIVDQVRFFLKEARKNGERIKTLAENFDISDLKLAEEKKEKDLEKQIEKLAGEAKRSSILDDFAVGENSGLIFGDPFGTEAPGKETLTKDIELLRGEEEGKDSALKEFENILPYERVDSISFMGMGEPLANPHVFDAISQMTHENLLGLSPRRLNVSTIGVLPGLVKLTEMHPQVNVAFSLHSPFPEERLKMMPIQKVYPFEKVFDVLDEHVKRTGRRVWIAYLMLKGRNDSRKHAEELARIIKNRPSSVNYLYHVNLLPYNTARSVNEPFSSAEEDAVKEFRKILEEAGISTSFRQAFGRSIDAACGQLFASYEAKNAKSMAL